MLLRAVAEDDLRGMVRTAQKERVMIIKQALAQYAASTRRTFVDRDKTVGASEIGQCWRKTWYTKNGTPRDGDRSDWGSAARGTLIETHLLVPAMRARFGERLLLAGDEQQTVRKDELSATPDGVVTDLQ